MAVFTLLLYLAMFAFTSVANWPGVEMKEPIARPISWYTDLLLIYHSDCGLRRAAA